MMTACAGPVGTVRPLLRLRPDSRHCPDYRSEDRISGRQHPTGNPLECDHPRNPSAHEPVGPMRRRSYGVRPGASYPAENNTIASGSTTCGSACKLRVRFRRREGFGKQDTATSGDEQAVSTDVQDSEFQVDLMLTGHQH